MKRLFQAHHCFEEAGAIHGGDVRLASGEFLAAEAAGELAVATIGSADTGWHAMQAADKQAMVIKSTETIIVDWTHNNWPFVVGHSLLIAKNCCSGPCLVLVKSFVG